MKVLNLYAGIGGNRKLWTNCEVTAVELDQKIAAVIGRNQVMGCQFHPEKSGEVGLKILKKLTKMESDI